MQTLQNGPHLQHLILCDGVFGHAGEPVNIKNKKRVRVGACNSFAPGRKTSYKRTGWKRRYNLRCNVHKGHLVPLRGFSAPVTLLCPPGISTKCAPAPMHPYGWTLQAGQDLPASVPPLSPPCSLCPSKSPPSNEVSGKEQDSVPMRAGVSHKNLPARAPHSLCR